jgi:hypothetical protein
VAYRNRCAAYIVGCAAVHMWFRGVHFSLCGSTYMAARRTCFVLRRTFFVLRRTCFALRRTFFTLRRTFFVPRLPQCRFCTLRGRFCRSHGRLWPDARSRMCAPGRVLAGSAVAAVRCMAVSGCLLVISVPAGSVLDLSESRMYAALPRVYGPRSFRMVSILFLYGVLPFLDGARKFGTIRAVFSGIIRTVDRRSRMISVGCNVPSSGRSRTCLSRSLISRSPQYFACWRYSSCGFRREGSDFAPGSSVVIWAGFRRSGRVALAASQPARRTRSRTGCVRGTGWSVHGRAQDVTFHSLKGS